MSTDDLHERLQEAYSLLEDLRRDYSHSKFGGALAGLSGHAEDVLLQVQDEIMEDA